MPYAPKKPCAYPMCRNKVKKGYCPKHEKFDTSTKFRNKRTKTDPFYLAAPWRAVSKQFRKQHPNCKLCWEQDGRVSKADVVDHIIPRSQGGADYSYSNLQGLCHSCHNRKTARENK